VYQPPLVPPLRSRARSPTIGPDPTARVAPSSASRAIATMMMMRMRTRTSIVCARPTRRTRPSHPASVPAVAHRIVHFVGARSKRFRRPRRPRVRGKPWQGGVDRGAGHPHALPIVRPRDVDVVHRVGALPAVVLRVGGVEPRRSRYDAPRGGPHQASHDLRRGIVRSGPNRLLARHLAPPPRPRLDSTAHRRPDPPARRAGLRKGRGPGMAAPEADGALSGASEV
jgi:hypothetical protein